MQIPRRLLPAIHELHAFEATARTGSISGAARELDLTQSAVSRQIKSLEAQLGLELFIREKQRVRLTLAGQSYARDIREALRRVSTASLAIRANPLGGTLNLGVLPTFAARWLIPHLHRFAERYPGININLFSRPTPFDFNLDSIDAAIHFGKPEWPEAAFESLFGESVLPIGSPALMARAGIRKAKDVRKVPLLILLSRPDAWERWLEHHGAPAEGVHGTMFDQFEMLIQAARHGLGLALLPTFLVADELKTGALVPAPIKEVPSPYKYYLAFPPERGGYAPLVAFREWLAEEAASSH